MLKRDHPVRWPKKYAPGAESGLDGAPRRKPSTKQTNKPDRAARVESAVAAINLMLNGNCESNTLVPRLAGETDDFNSNSTFERSAALHNSGTYSYKFTKTNAAGAISYVYFHSHSSITTDDMAGLIAGRTYTLRAWLYIPAASGILGSELNLYLYDYVSSWVGTAGAAANVYDIWQRITVTRTLRSAATGVVVEFNANADAALNEYFYVDDIELVEA